MELRDRIAAVLIAHPDKWDGTCCGEPNLEIEVQEDWAVHVADAVIAELGLRLERHELLHRWVTGWSQGE